MQRASPKNLRKQAGRARDTSLPVGRPVRGYDLGKRVAAHARSRGPDLAMRFVSRGLEVAVKGEAGLLDTQRVGLTSVVAERAL